MKAVKGAAVWVLVLAARAAAQDASDPIYDENAIRTFRLTMSAGDWSAIVNGDGETWRRATMVWEGPNGAETVDGVGVKASGHGTLTARQKQSIRISFNEFEFDALKRRWRNINRIKLDSMEGNLDTSFSRDRVAFWLMRQAGNAAPRLAHCHLHVNGAYKGVYIAVEPVRKDFARYRWGGDDDGNLFEQDGHGSGAYDWRGTSPGSYVPGWFNEENAPAPVNYGDLVQLIDIVNNRSGDDRRNQLAALIDYPVFMRHLAVTTVYGDGDDIAHWGGGWCNNHFWYHHEGGKMRIIKWDPDASQGRFYQNADQPLGYQWGQSDMVDWIAGDPTAWNDYKQAVAAVLSGPAAQVQAKIDAIYNQIRQIAYDDPLKSFSDAEFDNGKNFLKDWWRRRLAYLATQVQVTAATNNAAFVSQTVPTAMTAGQTASVTVRMRNSGTTTWSAPAYSLGSQNPENNTTWDADGRVGVPSSIAPGQEAAFTWTVTAPSTAGTYNFQWRMRQSGVEWFGATTPNVAVVVSAAPTPPPPTTPPPATAAYDADFVSQVVPATMTAGQTYSVTLKMKNMGTDTWRPGDDDRLGSMNPESNTTWGANRISLPSGAEIATGQEATFTWQVQAPATPGTYNFQWQMRQSLIDLWFGDLSTNVAVVVTAPPTTPPPTTPPPAGTNLSTFVSQSAPAALTAGQVAQVSVTLRNAGTTTWTRAAGYQLSSRGPRDNPTWGLSRVLLAAGDSIAPGQSKTFTFDVTAPSTNGTHPMSWSMVQDGVDWFDAVTPVVQVTVTGAAPAPVPPPAAAAWVEESGGNANGDGWINDKCAASASGIGFPWALLLPAAALLLRRRRVS
jgi:hypothetical protein